MILDVGGDINLRRDLKHEDPGMQVRAGELRGVWSTEDALHILTFSTRMLARKCLMLRQPMPFLARTLGRHRIRQMILPSRNRHMVVSPNAAPRLVITRAPLPARERHLCRNQLPVMAKFQVHQEIWATPRMLLSTRV